MLPKAMLIWQQGTCSALLLCRFRRLGSHILSIHPLSNLFHPFPGKLSQSLQFCLCHFTFHNFKSCLHNDLCLVLLGMFDKEGSLTRSLRLMRLMRKNLTSIWAPCLPSDLTCSRSLKSLKTLSSIPYQTDQKKSLCFHFKFLVLSLFPTLHIHTPLHLLPLVILHFQPGLACMKAYLMGQESGLKPEELEASITKDYISVIHYHLAFRLYVFHTCCCAYHNSLLEARPCY